MGNEHDARDVLQETYLRAFRKLGKFRGDAAFGTWLYRITVNCSATLVAKRRRTSHVELDDDLEILERVRSAIRRRRRGRPTTASASSRPSQIFLTRCGWWSY